VILAFLVLLVEDRMIAQLMIDQLYYVQLVGDQLVEWMQRQFAVKIDCIVQHVHEFQHR
jgi:hypothetical protein